jgi:hypothetical protein
MGWFKRRGDSILEAKRHYGWIVAILAVIAGGVVGHAWPQINVLFGSGPEGTPMTFFGIPVFAWGIGIAGLLFGLWMLEYATKKRLELKGIVDLESALDVLSEYLTEGNDHILNAKVSTDTELGSWLERQKQWQAKVESFLEISLALENAIPFATLSC